MRSDPDVLLLTVDYLLLLNSMSFGLLILVVVWNLFLVEGLILINESPMIHLLQDIYSSIFYICFESCFN